MTEPDAKLLTTAECAALLRRAPETLARWRRLKMGPPYLRVYGRVLYDRAAVLAWAQSDTVQ